MSMCVSPPQARTKCASQSWNRVSSSVLSYVCSHDTVSLSQFHPQHCLGSLAGISSFLIIESIGVQCGDSVFGGLWWLWQFSPLWDKVGSPNPMVINLASQPAHDLSVKLPWRAAHIAFLSPFLDEPVSHRWHLTVYDVPLYVYIKLYWLYIFLYIYI